MAAGTDYGTRHHLVSGLQSRGQGYDEVDMLFTR